MNVFPQIWWGNKQIPPYLLREKSSMAVKLDAERCEKPTGAGKEG